MTRMHFTHNKAHPFTNPGILWDQKPCSQGNTSHTKFCNKYKCTSGVKIIVTKTHHLQQQSWVGLHEGASQHLH